MSKRLFDVLVACAGIVLCAPILAVAVVALRIERPGSILHITRRAGRGGHDFRLYRFRTMIDAAPQTPVDERLTRVGRFIRNYSLDDLPQLFNVLKGDMSIIGPRPFLVEEVGQFDPAWQRILTVRPGLISYAILRLRRDYNTASLMEKQRLELEYVRRASLWFDLRLLGRALWALVRSRGNVKARG